MPRPKLHKHQYPPQSANEVPFEFSSKSGGGLLTLTDTGEKLIVDLFQLDNTVEVRVPTENLATRESSWEYEHAGTVLGAFENAYVGALVRRSDDPACYARNVGSDGDVAVHKIRLRGGVLELMIIDPPEWINAAEYVIVQRPKY